MLLLLLLLLHLPSLLLLPLLLLQLPLRLTSEDSNDSISEALQLSKKVGDFRTLQPAKLLAAHAQQQQQQKQQLPLNWVHQPHQRNTCLLPSLHFKSSKIGH